MINYNPVTIDILLNITDDMVKSPLLFFLTGLIGFDLIIGRVKAYLNKEYHSKKGINGLIKHSIVYMFILFVTFNCFLFDIQIIAQGIIVLFSIDYLISIIENLEDIGIKIPKVFKERLLTVKERQEEEFRK